VTSPHFDLISENKLAEGEDRWSAYLSRNISSSEQEAKR